MSEDWTMITCTEMPHIRCHSGLCSVITVNRLGGIRVDMMRGCDPVISFGGKLPTDIIRNMEHWFARNILEISMSHAMYIGRELERAFMEGVADEQG